MGDAVQRVVVTGSQGYIGSVLIGALLDEGYETDGRDLGLYHRCAYPSGNFELRPWDMRSAEPKDFEGFDAVVHLSALSNDPLGDLDPSLTYEINHAGTVRVAEAAKEAGVSRFLFASSCSLYGVSAGEDLLDESADMAPLTPYAETKVSAESALSEMADDSFSPTFLRNATVYGPSPALRLDIVVNDLCASAVATGAVMLMSDGMAWRPQVHVTDVARAVIAILQSDRAVIHDEAFNIGRSDDNLRVLDLAEAIAESIPNGRIEFADSASADARSYRVDFSKVESLIPTFQPKWTVAEGVRELLDIFARDGLTSSSFTRYRRLHEIRRLLDEGRISEGLTWL
jgi:nucleoside-diphosphate-sugar epimerase